MQATQLYIDGVFIAPASDGNSEAISLVTEAAFAIVAADDTVGMLA